MNHDELVLKVAALKVISSFTAERYNEARDEIAGQMSAGDRLIARSPISGAKIGAVSKTDPKAKTLLTDVEAFTQWFATHYPEHLVTAYKVIGTEKEVAAVLFEHAPHLLRQTREVSRDVVAEVKRVSAEMGHPVGPGGEVDVPGLSVDAPESDMRTVADKSTALAAVVELLKSGRLELDGSVTPELPGGAM